mgnify:CR=1 FL=1|jgi:hypothetical protein
MDDAEIRARLMERDALRREMGLPPLDIEREVRQACDAAARTEDGRRREALREKYARELEGIRNTVIAEMRAGGNVTFPNGWNGHYLLKTTAERRFAEFISGITGDQAPSDWPQTILVPHVHPTSNEV